MAASCGVPIAALVTAIALTILTATFAPPRPESRIFTCYMARSAERRPLRPT